MINFLEGRLTLRFFEEGFDSSIRESNAECMMVHLSLFVALNPLLSTRRIVECLGMLEDGLNLRDC